MTPEEINSAFLWPTAEELPQRQIGSPLYKHDPLLAQLENLVTGGIAWTPILGSTKRTESEVKLTEWLGDQMRQKSRFDAQMDVSFPVELTLDDFPLVADRQASRIVTTSRNIAYLIDRKDHFLAALARAFGDGQAARAEALLSGNLGVFVYVTNSVESGGRAFSGDPFTGQGAAYSRIFAHDLLGRRVLYFVAYYPHQLYSQLFTRTGAAPNNKGVKMLREQASLIVTTGGVLIEPQDWRLVR